MFMGSYLGFHENTIGLFVSYLQIFSFQLIICKAFFLQLSHIIRETFPYDFQTPFSTAFISSYRCGGGPLQCYYLSLMSQTANATSNPTQSMISSAWNGFNCTVATACNYEYTFMPPQSKPPNFVKPNACKNVTGPLPQQGRRKRQAPPGLTFTN